MTIKPFSLFFKLMVAGLLCVTVMTASTLRAESVPAQKKLMVFGDSLVAGYGLPNADSFPAQLEARLKREGYDIKVINAGVSGDTTSAGLTRLDWALGQKPDYFVLVLGGNDMLRQVDRAVTRSNLDKIVAKVRAQNIPVLIAGMRAYENLAAAGGENLAAIYADVGKKHGAAVYPFFLEGVAMNADLNLDDGIHPNTRGIGVIVDNMLPDVKKLLAE